MKHQWKIFVISLRRVRKRRQQVLSHLLPLGLPFEIIDAVDARQMKPECLMQGDDPPGMPVGAFGCYHSHLGALERIMDYGLDYGIILEDDFVPGDAPTLTLGNLMDRIPPGADHIQLHMFRDFMCPGYEIEEEGKWFNKLRHTSIGTIGYVVSRKLAAHVLEWHGTPRMQIDLLFLEISKSRSFNFYDVRENLIGHDWNLPSCINATKVETARPKVLCYTVAVDLEKVKYRRQQARMLVASLKRSGFTGDIKIVHNGETEIFDHPHPGVEEIGIDAPDTPPDCERLKFKVRDLLSVEGYDRVLFLDPGVIISGSLKSWFQGPEIIRHAMEPADGIHGRHSGDFPRSSGSLKSEESNCGAFVIKADYFHEVLARWEKIDADESDRCRIGVEHAWNRLLLHANWPTKPLANPEVRYFHQNAPFMEMLEASVLHYGGCGDDQKVLAMQAKFISHFHTDGDGTLIRLLER